MLNPTNHLVVKQTTTDKTNLFESPHVPLTYPSGGIYIGALVSSFEERSVHDSSQIMEKMHHFEKWDFVCLH